MDDESAIPPPVVFQCASCLVIVADSLSWVRATSELRTITLASAPEGTISVSDTLSTSHDGHDLGSTYASFACANCSAVLGKIYRTTPRHLDDLRDYLTFDAAALKNYQVGTEEPARGPLPADADLDILKPEPNALAQRLAIMETVIMAMHDEIESLKSALGSSTDDSSLSENAKAVNAARRRKR
ncbi:yippee zinc-binding/DNA-binding /Mis18, centromere assembly-domain-containing protein [Myxozyma melibiosi]|uniref:Yippee zinc-binding/DNA-binding /Mis18, centromere assembly-domain-containing protein n=1 Tax=Myxozyma melibiosi TaxID=54550 RepID=A0ABR1FAU1_9ASCO